MLEADDNEEIMSDSADTPEKASSSISLPPASNSLNQHSTFVSSLEQPHGQNSASQSVITIAVEGCCHGELDKIYGAILRRKETVDILFICGDFQCFADETDLAAVAMPQKYRKMNSFHEYVSGTKVAPVLTVFVGGNHEASNILHSLYYGGFVAPNIYFMGFAGVVNFRGLRIGGLSGIFKHKDYRMGHHEVPPYSETSKRTVYHLRELEIYRMAHLLSVHRGDFDSSKLDVFISHDWPTGIWQFGDCEHLMQIKPFLREDVASGKLGSPPLMQMLRMLKPKRWFAAHLHVRFDALVEHADTASAEKTTDTEKSIVPPPEKKETRFMALDKVLPGRDFLQFLQIPAPTLNEVSYEVEPPPSGDDGSLKFDVEWMAILRKTHTLLQTCPEPITMPTVIMPVTTQELTETETLLRGTYPDLSIPGIPPRNLPPARGLFVPNSGKKNRTAPIVTVVGNFQTDMLLSGLGLPHIWTIPVAAQVQAQAQAQAQAPAKGPPERYAQPIGKRKYHEANSSWRKWNAKSDRHPKPSQKAAYSSKEIQGKPGGKYGGWYPTLPSSSKNDSSNGGNSSDPNALDI